eukprot:gene453-6864_t
MSYKERIIQLWKKSGKKKIAGIPPVRYTFIFFVGSVFFVAADQGLELLKRYSRSTRENAIKQILEENKQRKLKNLPPVDPLEIEDESVRKRKQ